MAAGVVVPTMLEVVDTTVVNVALPHIQGSLNASVDEVAWVVTSYLVANGIVIPMTAWLSSLFGRKRYFLLCIALFTASSFLCGSAPNLPMLVIFRLVQGASGAAMIPLSQAILMETFPPVQHGLANAVWGIAIMAAPIGGPLLGGWITDHYTWRWAFYINVPLGGLAVALVWAFVHDPGYVKRRMAAIDYCGLALLVVGLGCVQLVLDRGERADWFAATWVWALSLIGGLGLIAFVLQELRTREPIVDFRLTQNRTYAVSILMNFLLGFILYTSVLLQPLYAQTLMRYDALNAGVVLALGGVGTLFMMPVVGLLMNRVDARWFIGIGLAVAGYSMLMMAGVNLVVDRWHLIWPRLVWGVGMGLFFVPLSAVALGVVRREKMGDASALFNLMRNLGGSVGIALVVTLLSRRAQYHQHVLTEHVTANDPEAVQRFHALAHGLWQSGSDAVTAQTQAARLLYAEVQRQSALLSFIDAFWLVGVVALLCAPLVIVMRRFVGGRSAAH